MELIFCGKSFSMNVSRTGRVRIKASAASGSMEIEWIRKPALRRNTVKSNLRNILQRISRDFIKATVGG